MPLLGIIQARLGSTRFPRKVLAPLAGQPLLRHVVDRVRAIPSVETIVVAVPAGDERDIAHAAGPGVAVMAHPGPEGDVLARFASVVETFHSYASVMRITSDCPLLNPDIAESVVQLHQESGACYTWNVAPGYVDGEDVEVITREAILWAHQRATDAEDREHVTPFIRRHLTVSTLPPPDDRGWMTKTSVDTMADLTRVRKLLQ